MFKDTERVWRYLFRRKPQPGPEAVPLPEPKKENPNKWIGRCRNMPNELEWLKGNLNWCLRKKSRCENYASVARRGVEGHVAEQVAVELGGRISVYMQRLQKIGYYDH